MTYEPTRPLDYQSAPFGLRISTGSGGRWDSGYRSSFDLDVDNNPGLVWPLSADMVFQTSASTLIATSSDAADTLLGTGARRILIIGLDADHKVISEIIDTNGLTGTTTTLAYLRLNVAICLNVGTAENNVGDISIASTGTADIIGYIPKELGKHISSVVTVPENRWMGITDFYAEVAGNDTLEILLESRHPGDSWRALEVLIVPTAGTTRRQWSLTAPIMIQPKSDVRIIAQKVGGGQATSCSVSYNFYTIDSREVPLTDDLADI